jgi:hypothetical protein
MDNVEEMTRKGAEEMALTRKLLAAMGIEAEKVDEIIAAHVETVDALKKERDGYKADAGKVADLEAKLAEAEAKGGDDGYKAKYDKLNKDFETYKAEIEAGKAHDAKETAVRAYLKEKGIGDKHMALALRAIGADIDGLELDGETIKDAKSLDDALAGDLAPLVTVTDTKGASTATPPDGGGDGGNGGGNIFGGDGSFFF